MSSQPPLSGADEALIDGAARRRCQTLKSVDDAYAQLVQTVKDLGTEGPFTYDAREIFELWDPTPPDLLGQWDNTYWVISSDHGYNLGHHRIPSNKFLLYDHAVRIPAVVRGPGIKVPGRSILKALAYDVTRYRHCAMS